MEHRLFLPSFLFFPIVPCFPFFGQFRTPCFSPKVPSKTHSVITSAQEAASTELTIHQDYAQQAPPPPTLKTVRLATSVATGPRKPCLPACMWGDDMFVLGWFLERLDAEDVKKTLFGLTGTNRHLPGTFERIAPFPSPSETWSVGRLCLSRLITSLFGLSPLGYMSYQMVPPDCLCFMENPVFPARPN